MQKYKKARIQLSAENFEKVMAHYGYRKHRPIAGENTYVDGTPFGVLRFWR